MCINWKHNGIMFVCRRLMFIYAKTNWQFHMKCGFQFWIKDYLDTSSLAPNFSNGYSLFKAEWT
jgi:hypothetical protein